MRGSRTFSIPIPMKYLSLEGRTRNNFHSPHSDHPSVTLALIPSAAKPEADCADRTVQALSNPS